MDNVSVLFTSKDLCCGCSACAAICPTDAIQMFLDEDGYYYPRVNEDLCVKCMQCTRVCVLKSKTDW